MNENMKKSDAHKYYLILTPDSFRIVQGKYLAPIDFVNTIVSKGFNTFNAAADFTENLYTDECILTDES